MDKKRIAVVFGGKSDEYEVSQNSAANVIRALDPDKYIIYQIGITREGRWFWTPAMPEQIADGSWATLLTNRQVVIPHDPTVHGFLMFNMIDMAEVKDVDCIIPVLHGDHGEDGEIQGLFSMSEIPFVGPGVKASANCMDKATTKEIAKLVGVRMAKHYVIKLRNYLADSARELESVMECHEGRFPLFVKPSSAGSSVGVSKVHNVTELKQAVAEAFKYDRKVLVEETIVGREFEVAVLGNEKPQASCVGEILTAGEFYSYDSKYNNPESQTRVVDDLPEEVLNKFREAAVNIYSELDCAGLSRVDFFYSEDGEVVFNEINTLPGFTNISMYPKLWEHCGVPANELLDKLIELAMEEHSEWMA